MSGDRCEITLLPDYLNGLCLKLRLVCWTVYIQRTVVLVKVDHIGSRKWLKPANTLHVLINLNIIIIIAIILVKSE